MWNLASNAIASLKVRKPTLSSSRSCPEVFDDDVCSNLSREEGLECPICWESFNIVENVPYVLWCGHTLCRNCVIGLQLAVFKFPTQKIQVPFFVSCPWCHFLSLRLVYKGNLKFPSKNYFLLSLVESLNSERLKALSPFTMDYQPLFSTSTNILENQPSNSNRSGGGSWSPNSMGSFRNGGSYVYNRPNVERHHYAHRHEFIDLFFHFTSKLPLVLMLLLIIFFVVPTSSGILALYLLLTVLVAVPSFMVLYFTCLILGWLMREITA